MSEAYTVKGQEEHWGIASFHTSFEAANKAGNTYINTAANSAREERATYGSTASACTTSFRVVPVEVLDEGFNAS